MKLRAFRMRRMVVAVAGILPVIFTATDPLFAQPTVNAGPDATIQLGQSYSLQGAVELSPLEFWTADGNDATEDMLIKYNELSGITAVGPILSTEAQPRYFGFPSDLQRVGDLIYGIETYHRQFYLLDPETGAATVIGPRTQQTQLMSLAYDAVNDRMFSIDVASDKLVRINRVTGATFNVGTIGAIYGNTRALAYDQVSGLLYAADYNKTTKLTTLYTVDPANMQKNVVMILPTNAFTLYDELEFYRDELYAVLSIGPFVSCQLQHINLNTGEVTNVGPVISGVSAHSLVIQSMPEEYSWSVVSGPGEVTIDDPLAVDSEVAFAAPGTYELALTAYADAGNVIDTVVIEVTSGACQTDTDADGTVDCLDECPNDFMKSVMGQCGCGVEDIDTDGDAVADCLDGCPLDAEKSTPGACGCGFVDMDSDSDGTADCVDGCPNDAGKIESGLCGCGNSDADSDGDGTVDCLDGCPSDPNKSSEGVCGCGISDGDFDGDGALDCQEECPADPGKTLPGLCGCGIADSDSDGDQTPDCLDGCPDDPSLIEAGICGCGVPAVDMDGDGTPDCVDGCPSDALKTGPGMCGCGIQDVDSDGDMVADCNDGCPDDPNKIVMDLCGCGAPPSCDDGNACTQDSCDPQSGCVHFDFSSSCDDGLFCNGTETCDAQFGCVAGVDPCGGDTCNEGTGSCGSTQPKMWMIFNGAPVIPDVGVVEQADVVSYEPVGSTWALEFDGSDVGLAGQSIDGFARLTTGELLFSFTVPLDIPGLIGGPGGTTLVDDSDIVMFSPASLGENTAGTFVFYFDGSDVGLSADNEDVDSICIAPDGRLVLSTLGAVIAPGVNGAAHDLFVMNATALGSVTAGTFEMYFKGASTGLSNGTENIVGLSILANGDFLLTTSGPFAVPGLSGTNKDVMHFTPQMLGPDTQGAFSMFLQTMPLGIPSTARIAELEWVP